MSAETDPKGLAAMPEVTEEQRRDKARIQIRENAVKHTLGPLLPEDGDKPKFCQIYHIDQSQDALERRMEADTGGQDLDNSTLRELQRLMKYRNPYARAFTNCGDRIKDSEDIGVKVTLKQHDPRSGQRGTHNKPTSDEGCLRHDYS